MKLVVLVLMCLFAIGDQSSVDGVWEQWNSWSACTVTCGGGGTQARTRHCVFPPHVQQGDYCAGSSRDTRTCNYGLCPVDGIWEQWTPWSHCTVTCGGIQARTRQCVYPPHVPQGHYCAGDSFEQTTCNTDTCPVDGIWEQWNSWSACTLTCGGGGTKYRTRHCMYPGDAPHGDDCYGDSAEQTTCNIDTCPDAGCTSFADCTHTCDNIVYRPVCEHGICRCILH